MQPTGHCVNCACSYELKHRKLLLFQEDMHYWGICFTGGHVIVLEIRRYSHKPDTLT